MKKLNNAFIILAISVLFSACSTAPALAPAGQLTAGQSVTLDREWSDYGPLYGLIIPKTKVKFLTIDGATLNRLYISEGLTPKDPLFIGPAGDRKVKPAPRATENMSLTEQMEYIAKAIGELGYSKIETQSPKPVMISGQKGIRFELSMKTVEGLNFSGLAQAVSKDDKNYYIIYLAPTQHYYKKHLENVIKTMDSATLP